MKLVFCGTPEFAVPTLEAVIAAGHDVALVVTQPDRAAGRGMEMHAPPVKHAALAHGIPVVQPEKIKNNAEFRAQLEAHPAGRDRRRRLRPHHSAVDARPAAARQHQSARFAAAEVSRRRARPVGGRERRDGHRRHHHAHRRGPRYRGHAARARACPLRPKRPPPMSSHASPTSAPSLMVEDARRLAAGTLTPQPQDHAWQRSRRSSPAKTAASTSPATAQTIYNRWRGFQPWPGAHTTLRGKKLIVHRMRAATAQRGLAPGRAACRRRRRSWPAAATAPRSLLRRSPDGRQAAHGRGRVPARLPAAHAAKGWAREARRLDQATSQGGAAQSARRPAHGSDSCRPRITTRSRRAAFEILILVGAGQGPQRRPAAFRRVPMRSRPRIATSPPRS